MNEKLLTWLRDKKNYLKIRHIEEELGIPQSTLNKYLTGASEEMPDKWKEKVIEWVKEFKK
jgi:transcriptional antiterminator